jgi:hypothetical protein
MKPALHPVVLVQPPKILLLRYHQQANATARHCLSPVMSPLNQNAGHPGLALSATDVFYSEFQQGTIVHLAEVQTCPRGTRCMRI